MVIILFTVICSVMIIFFGIAKRKDANDTSSRNPDLLIFYESYAEPVCVRMKLLLRAAKTMIEDCTRISEEMSDITHLHDEKLVSDEYYYNIKNLEEELEIEKIVIENEAESIKPGLKQTIFSEAMKLPSSESSKKSSKRCFDEDLYMKKKENLMKDLVSRISNDKQ